MTYKSFRNGRLVPALLATIVLGSEVVGEQRRETTDAYGTAHLLLKVFYPSLLHRNLVFGSKGSEGVPFDSFGTPLMHFVVTVIAPPSRGELPSRATEVLSGHFDFDFNGSVTSWVASPSEFVNYPQRHEIEPKIQGQRKTDEEIGALLLRANARFGIDSQEELAAFIQPLLDRLEPYTGKLTIRSTTFARAVVAWQVIAGPPGGETDSYSFLFEPFEGKLIALRRLTP